MKTRILVAVPIAAILLLAVFLQGWVLASFAVAIAIIAQYEVVRAFDNSGHKVIRSVSVGYACALAALFMVDFSQPSWYSTPWFSAAAILSVLIAAVMLTLVVAMFAPAFSFESVLRTLFTLLYPQLFFVCLYGIVLLCQEAGGALAYATTVLALLMLFMPPVLSDTVAYFWGRAFGRRKLCPEISPNKTVAGSVAGLVGGALGGLLVWWGVSVAASPYFSPTLSAGAYFAIGAVLAVVSQLGDLVASYIKRYVGIKDFGKLLPGHGGVLDRIDSTAFTLPVVELCVAAGWITLIHNA